MAQAHYHSGCNTAQLLASLSSDIQCTPMEVLCDRTDGVDPMSGFSNIIRHAARGCCSGDGGGLSRFLISPA